MISGIVGHSVERVCFDFAVTMVIGAGEEIRIETDFSIRSPHGGSVTVEIGSLGRSAELVCSSVLHSRVIAADVDEEVGSLTLDFESGAQIMVAPSVWYEAWSFTAVDGVRVIALPGGGVSIWGLGERAGA